MPRHPARGSAPHKFAPEPAAIRSAATATALASAGESTRGGALPLDLHEGIVPPGSGCDRWPARLKLRYRDAAGGVGFVAGRCRATNLCAYCRTLYTVETAEMLLLDAMEWPPTLWAVLTAREHLTRADCRAHLDHLRRAVLRLWPRCEWHVQVEVQKRGALHLNLLVKGVGREDRVPFQSLLVERWCARVDAEPVGQCVRDLYDAGGIVRYLGKSLTHGLKQEQAPPLGWKGHRTSQTRGYLVRPASEMRLEARRALRLKRALHRGVPADMLEPELELEDARVWDLVDVGERPVIEARTVGAPGRREGWRPYRGTLVNATTGELW